MKGLLLDRGLGGRATIAVVACVMMISGCGQASEQIGPVGPVGRVGSDSGEPGSGNIVSERRDIEGATRVLFESEGDVVITAGSRASLTVETDDNLLSLIETAVEEDILRIKTATGVDIAPTRPPQFRITMPDITEIELGGVGTIDVDRARSDIFGLSLTGVGDIVLTAVDVDLLLFDLSGVGSVTIEGTAADQRGVVAGQCRYLAADLESERAMLQASGSGHAEITVTEKLDVSAIDTASVEYYGSPLVTQDVEGLATITGHDDR